jgi:WD40 repeat protein
MTLYGHGSGVYSVAFSPDGTRIASGSFDNTIKLWDAATGAELRTLTGHTNVVNSVAFSPDGTRIYSRSIQEVLVWDAATGERLEDEPWKEIEQSQALSPDGRWLVVPSGVDVLLVDREFAKRPEVVTFRQSMARVRTFDHLQQANDAESRNDWYAAVFHRAWVTKGVSENNISPDDYRYSRADKALVRAYNQWRESIANTSIAQLPDPNIMFPPSVRDVLSTLPQ